MTADYSGLADLIVAASKGFPRVGRTAPEVGFGGSVSSRLPREHPESMAEEAGTAC